MNGGEKNELLIKIMLVWLRDNPYSLSSHLFNKIESVGFDHEYLPLSKDFDISNIYLMADSNIQNLANSLKIEKASGRAKADVYINKTAYSVKSLQNAPPALVNHTSRPGFEIACRHSNANIEDLDAIVADYWDLRQKGLIREDIKNTDSNSPFRNHKEILQPILEYFLFQGSGSGPSSLPANFILDFNSPTDLGTWRVLTPDDAVDLLWPKLVFSLRSKKGMPTNYPNNRNQSQNESIGKWTRHFQGDYRGSLHIRAIR